MIVHEAIPGIIWDMVGHSLVWLILSIHGSPILEENTPQIRSVGDLGFVAPPKTGPRSPGLKG